MYSCGPFGYSQTEVWEKADSLQCGEGSNPVCGMASEQDSTGVLERGMCSQGQLGNLGEPRTSLSITGNEGQTGPKIIAWRRWGRFLHHRRADSGVRKSGSSKVPGSESESEATRDGGGAVLADHITDGVCSFAWAHRRKGGEPMSKGPVAGKGRPGITFSKEERWEIHRGRKLS